MEGDVQALRESLNAKDEQISLLKAVLVQLSDELKRKDERIAELESQQQQQQQQQLHHKDPSSSSSSSLQCPYCLQGQSSPPENISSPVAMTRRISSSERLAMVPNLSPIDEGTPSSSSDRVFSLPDHHHDDDDNASNSTNVGDRGEKGGCHSNKGTPRKRKLSVLDHEQQELQMAIATLDSSIAELELQTTSEQRLKGLRRERTRMMTELNRKVQSRLRKVRRNSDDVFTKLATDYENFNRAQMCEAVRELDRAQAKYKVYIDQLLAVVLEANSALLEGMPRLQQSNGLRLDLLRMASRGELFEDIQEREKNIASLESYATQLSQRLLNHALPLLPVLDPFHDATGMESSQNTTLYTSPQDIEPMIS